MHEQRIRVVFTKGNRLRFISHLDTLRAWERAIRRADLPLSYSNGFTPHPRLAFASPLPLGFAGDAEVMDVTLNTRVPLGEVVARLAAQTSPDLAVVQAFEVPPGSPQPQAVMLWADYAVELPRQSPSEAIAVVSAFLSRSRFDWTEERHDRSRTYDLRSTVAELSATSTPGDGTRLEMRLQSDQEFSSRPEQVVAALFPGQQATGYTRKGVVLAQTSIARERWRRTGRFF